jgi:hypothetical protein
MATPNKIAGIMPNSLPLLKRKINPANNPAKTVASEQGM